MGCRGWLARRLKLAVYAFAWVLVAASSCGWRTALAERVSVSVAELRCDERNIVVRSPERLDASTACEGARDAIVFLASHGLDVSSEIEIDVVPRLPAVAGHSEAAGRYLESQGRVLILAYSEFEKQKPWLGLPSDRRLYRSLASHEVAHAVAARNFLVPQPSIQATEYIAYVTMLATMDPADRERVLTQFPGEGFEGDWQMSSTIYLFDPERFGVHAYRHFLKPANGRRYLHEILSGKVLVE